MDLTFDLLFLFTAVTICIRTVATTAGAGLCGCKINRQCYTDMVYELHEGDEKICIDDVEVSTSAYLVYFKALLKYCGHIFYESHDYQSSDSRNLYEIVIHMPKQEGDGKDDKKDNANVPIIFLEAGQTATLESVRLVLTIIERLTACEENEHMIQTVKWVILPCTNPDGIEYVRFDRPDWTKNTRKTGDGASYGIDISRNFDAHWNDCEKTKSMLDLHYPGPSPASEIETKFIRNSLLKYKDDIKAYLSFRGEGHHGILYPHAFSEKCDDIDPRQMKVAELVSLKVNQRGGTLQAFVNDSIYNVNGKPMCGSSVDYAHSQGIPLSYEFRVGFEKDLEILKKFQHIPSGHSAALRASYFSGIRELYAIVSSNKDT